MNRLLARRGLAIRPILSYPDRHAHVLSLLSAMDIAPATVIDIGVSTGTPWLYDAFPNAHLVLIDPRATADVVQVPPNRSVDLLPVAAGAQAGALALRVDTRTPSSSSLLTVSSTLTAARAAKGDARTYHDVLVPVRPVDELVDAHHYRAPFVLKLDTEGYERDVLLGASATLARTAAVIAEVNVAKRFDGSYEFADIIALLHDHSFRLFDFVEVRTLGRHGPINYVDAVFIRRS